MVPQRYETFPTIGEIMCRPQWHRWAACRGQGPDQFISGSVGASYAQAKEQCASCEVRAECLDAALADESLAGVWGGTTTKERVRLRRGVA